MISYFIARLAQLAERLIDVEKAAGSNPASRTKVCALIRYYLYFIMSIISIETIEHRILFIRGHKVMLDRDLADLYNVKTRALRQQAKRNSKRFPPDFMFQLSKSEADILVSQNVTPKRRSFGGSLPYVFTEQGIAMLSSVLTSDRAIEVNIMIMRAFVKLRELLITHKDLARKIEDLERKHQQHDLNIQQIFAAIRKLMTPEPVPPRQRIGFRVD